MILCNKFIYHFYYYFFFNLNVLFIRYIETMPAIASKSLKEVLERKNDLFIMHSCGIGFAVIILQLGQVL